MNIIYGNHGKIMMIDNLDKENGINTLNKKYDLCLTDPPYPTKGGGISHFKHNRKILDYEYFDKKTPSTYWEYMKKWWNQIKKKAEIIIFTPGYEGFKEWLKIDDFHYIFWYNTAKNGGCVAAYHNIIEPILLYNIQSLPQSRRFKESCINYHYGVSKYDFKDLIHPCPRSSYIWELIINTIKPKSIIDPFMGSGTTAQICEKNKIEYIGYEKEISYTQDIKKRIKKGIYDSKNNTIQTTLIRG